MSGAGALMDMTRRFKQNRGKLDYRKNKQRELRHKILSGATAHNVDYYRDTVPSETLAVIKAGIREKYKKERRRNIGIGAVSFVLALLIVFIIFKYSVIFY